LQGASATEHILDEFAGKPVRAFVIWEPVLLTDWSSPSTATLSRLSDSRVAQFWDKGRLISRSMGEHDRRSIVWDFISIYPAGALWEDKPPEALYAGGPVVKVAGPARAALAQALERQPFRGNGAAR
jgi:hypothetical protein